MASCGIPRIDALLDGAGSAPIATNDANREAVGVLQDFLVCHGFTGMPGPLSAQRGVFDPRTGQCVREFQQACGLPETGQVDPITLHLLVGRPASSPVVSQGYLTLVLDIAYEGMTRLMSITNRINGGGRFAATDRNTDMAGLSFGLMQWSQKAGGLNQLLRIFQQAEPERFVRTFGGGDAGLAEGLIAHTAKPRGGTDARGLSTDPQFDLINETWVRRFRGAALDRALQRLQVDAATRAFKGSLDLLRQYAPDLKSERAIAFMLDLAHQHGDGGARHIYQSVGGRAAHPGEADMLFAIEKESVRRVRAQFGDGGEVASTQARRSGFRTSALLSDGAFVA